MSQKTFLAKLILLPLSKLYGIGVGIRNKMFDWHLLKEKEFDVPVIVVGNLAAGGTGKTPHVEYIIQHLRHSYHMAVVSRGYKRSTKGFIMATRNTSPTQIGDEPYRIYHKFNCEVTVAVCEDRVKGISELLRIDPQINLVILDDAYQHRYVKPTVSILLTEYNRPLYQDKLLPYGSLRESKSGLGRADIVVATKCPQRTTALDMRIFEENLKLVAYQKMYFSKFVYGKLMPVFPDNASPVAPALDWLTEEDMLLAIAGIGNPKPFVKYVRRFKPKVRVNIFSDHHNFSRKDMHLIQSRFESMTGRRNFIVTTEKDAVRLSNCPYFPHALKPYIFFLQVSVDFLREEQKAFIDEIRKTIKRKSL